MNEIDITHVKWHEHKSGKRCIGVALHKLREGQNLIRITARDKAGELLYPTPFIVTREDLLSRYEPTIINKNNLKGIWIPVEEIIFNGEHTVLS